MTSPAPRSTQSTRPPLSMKGTFLHLRWMNVPFIDSDELGWWYLQTPPAGAAGKYAGSFRTVVEYAGVPRARTGGTR